MEMAVSTGENADGLFCFFTALLYFIFLLVFPFGRATYWVLMGAGGPRFVIDCEG